MRPSRWASSWREPNVPEIWMATLASGRSTEKLATLDTANTRVGIGTLSPAATLDVAGTVNATAFTIA